jgi:hypothetical protein
MLLPAGPVIGLAAALPLTLLLLAISFGLTWGWHRVVGTPQRSFRQMWHFVKSAIVGFGVVVFCVVTLLPLHSTGPDQEFPSVSNLRTINTAQVTYRSWRGSYGTIPELITAGLLDSRYATSLSGYTFTIDASVSGYTATATPTSTKAGRFGYYSLEDAVVRYQRATSNICSPCFPNGQSGAPVQ